MGNKLTLGKQIKLTQNLSVLQKELIIGGLLGDGTIGLTRKGSPSFIFQHTEKSLDYILLKKHLLKNFVIREKPTLCIGRISKPISGHIVYSRPSYKIGTVTHQDFEEFDKLFYTQKNGKRIKIFKRELSNMITPLSLLFWYMDDGSLGSGGLYNSPFINLYTNNFSLGEQKRMQTMFRKKFTLNPKIQLIKQQNNYYLRFGVADVSELMRIFKPLKRFIPPSMSYKFTFLRQTVNPPHPR